jgi:hypothetical protein
MVRSIRKFAAIAIAAAALLIQVSLLPTVSLPSPMMALLAWVSPQVLLAQPSPLTEARQVYELLPDLPLENQYTSMLTGQVSPDNTLVSRMIDYHLYVRSRSPLYRLDWKLTLADYLGANEWINPATYPGNDSLQTNPIASDTGAIAQLNRSQRDALVAALVSAFGGGDDTPLPSPDPTSDSNLSPAPVQQPGAAQLLLQ